MLFRMMIKKESEWASELSIQKGKISKLEKKIKDMKQKNDRKLQQLIVEYENRLEVNRKQHEEELRIERGLSGSKLTSDTHHEGNTHTFTHVVQHFHTQHHKFIFVVLYD